MDIDLNNFLMHELHEASEYIDGSPSDIAYYKLIVIASAGNSIDSTTLGFYLGRIEDEAVAKLVRWVSGTGLLEVKCVDHNCLHLDSLCNKDHIYDLGMMDAQHRSEPYVEFEMAVNEMMELVKC